jgi:hypothetical protein
VFFDLDGGSFRFAVPRRGSIALLPWPDGAVAARTRLWLLRALERLGFELDDGAADSVQAIEKSGNLRFVLHRTDTSGGGGGARELAGLGALIEELEKI